MLIYMRLRKPQDSGGNLSCLATVESCRYVVFLSDVRSFWEEGTKAVRTKARDFDVVVDHPLEQKGTNLGPTPSEILLSALAGCFTGTMLPIALAMSIPIRSVALIVRAEKGERDYESLRSIEVQVKIEPE
jgi:uncharacterized OsmC-like protein